MLTRTILVLLFVYYVFAASTFIGEGKKRAELFELTDDELAEFHVTIPNEEFIRLKQEAQWLGEDAFKTKNGSLIVKLKGEEKSFKKLTFGIGGYSSRTFSKPGYNLKIRGKDNLYGRTQIRLRSDAREPTFLRSKLVCDIHNRLGLPSISANYATLYINDEYMGLFILLDAYKLSWVEFEYGDKDSTTLYQCKDGEHFLTLESSATGCKNENKDVIDHSEWIDLLTRLDAAQSAEDIEDIFDVDQFLTEIAYEYLAIMGSLSQPWSQLLYV